MATVEELAEEIARLSLADQERLLAQLEAITLQKGLHALAERYRDRLRRQGTLDESVEATWEALRKARDEVAARDYPC